MVGMTATFCGTGLSSSWQERRAQERLRRDLDEQVQLLKVRESEESALRREEAELAKEAAEVEADTYLCNSPSFSYIRNLWSTIQRHASHEYTYRMFLLGR